MWKKAFRAAFPLTLPVLAGYLVLGIGFGVLLQRAGFGIGWALLMSFTIYSGSMQYVGVSVLSSWVSLLNAAVITVTVNARYLFYGLSMLERFRGLGWKKLPLIFGLTDETYSIICTTPVPIGMNRGVFYLALSMLNQSYWIMGSCIGSLIGSAFAFDSAGMEFSMTALFVVLFVEQWLTDKDSRILAVIGVGLSFLCLVILGADRFIVPSMILIVVVLAFLRKPLQKKEAGQS